MGKNQKGSQFERSICRRLSTWWTRGQRDDIFWRTGGSGGRAKSRMRKGSQTHGQHGDIAATHPSGETLIDVLTLELKRGYSKHSLQDVMDRPARGSKQQIDHWVDQVVESWNGAGSFAWGIITKRDQREPLIVLPKFFIDTARSYDVELPYTMAILRYEHGGEKTLSVMRFDDWLEAFTPDHIRQLAKDC